MMQFSILTLFPEMFSTFLATAIIKRALQAECLSVELINIRDFTSDRHHTVDDRPYGGGNGMVMKPAPLAKAIQSVKDKRPKVDTILLSPQGRKFDQGLARDLAGRDELMLVCGRYEGIDERIVYDLVDMELSIGDYVLTGGELAAMVVVDSIARLQPGSLGNECSASEDSFSSDLIEYPQYTRPRCFKGEEVPEVLLSGNHGAIWQWRQRASFFQTLLKRPDLLIGKTLSVADKEILKKLQRDVQTIIESDAAVP